MVDQGLVNSRDASLLKPGELSKADDAYYKPGDPALWCVPGRTLYNAVPEAGAILGARFLGFDTVADQVVVQVGTGLRRGPATATGAFVDVVLPAVMGGSHLDSIHYNGQHVLTCGLSRAVVMDSTYATRSLGMLANTAPPTLSMITGAGPGFKITANSMITYWIEERVKVAGVITRRNSAPDGAFISFVSANSSTIWKPRITKPATVNTDATHWAVFATATIALDPTNPTAFVSGWPVGAEIGEATIATAFIDDTRIATKDPGFPPGPIYETMAIQLAGSYLNVPRNGSPPIFSTGDVMEESLLVNDVSDKAIVRFCWAEEIDKWPSLNFIKFQEKEQDEVRVVKAVGTGAVVLQRDSAWRIDYLPRPEDAEFNRGRCRSKIPGAPGVVNNPQAAAVISLGERYYLVYVSPVGVIMTDAFSQNVLTEDLDWPAMVNVTALDAANVVVNDAKFQIEVRYPATGSSVCNKVLLINFHPSHLKPGSGGGPRGKCSGPVARPSTAACAANISDLPGVYSAQGTSLYVEWAGTTDPATAVPIELNGASGDIYLSGLGAQAEISRVWIHHGAGAVASTIGGYLTSKNELQADLTQTWTVPAATREANNAPLFGLAEAYVVGAKITAPTTAQCINYFVLDGAESGEAKN